MARRLVISLLAALVLAASTEAAAQESEEARATARAALAEGMAATEEERWTDALSAFRAAYEAVPRAAILVNVATAQAELGQLLAARESLRQILVGSAGRDDPELASTARSALNEVERRLGHVEVEVVGADADDRLTVDGEPRTLAGGVLDVNPGQREIAVVRDGAVIASTRLDVAEGATVEVSLRPPPSARQVAEEAAAAEPNDGDEETERVEQGDASTEEGEADTGEGISPWVWVGIIAGALIAGGVVALVVLTSGSSDPYEGNVGTGVLRIR